jgi:CspA family cold shock protein
MFLLPHVPASVGHAPTGLCSGGQGAVDQQTHLSAMKGHDHMTTTNGTIKRVTDKGFGFITAEEGTEYFFHQSACAGTRFDELRAGQTVSFTVGQGPKGPRAENVNVINVPVTVPART